MHFFNRLINKNRLPKPSSTQPHGSPTRWILRTFLYPKQPTFLGRKLYVH